MPISLQMHARRRHAARATLAAIAGFLFIGAAARTVAAQPGAFVERHAEALQQSGRPAFEVTFTDERRAFRIGERIPVIVLLPHDAFTDINDFLSAESGAGLSVVADRETAHPEPRSDCYTTRMVVRDCEGPGGVRLLAGGGTGVSITVPGELAAAAAPSPPRLMKLRFELNAGIRFDRPGRYRVYLRWTGIGVYELRKDAAPPLVSNVMVIDILPREPSWDEATLQDALQVLGRPLAAYADNEDGRTLESYARRDRENAALTLTRLGTAAAIDVLVRLAYVPEHDEVARQTVLEGLYAAPDRRRVVARLEERLLDPRSTMPRLLVEDMAVLDLTLTHRERPLDRAAYDSRLRELAARRLRILKAARRFDLTSILPLASGFADLPRDVERALTSLPPAGQRDTLAREAPSFRDRAFIPMLERLATSRWTDGPQGVAAQLLNAPVGTRGPSRMQRWVSLTMSEAT